MKRRDFMANGAVASAGLLAALIQAKCSSSTTPGDPLAQRTFSSTSNNAHAHTITIQRTEVQNPPAGGISRQTSSASAHTHAFAMTQAELQTVMGGGSVNITTSTVDLHDHVFTITKWF